MKLPLATLAATLMLVSASSVAAAPRTIAIAGTEDMRFSVTRIDAKPGEELRIVLEGKGTMPKETMAHNFVLLDPSTDVATFVTAASVARTTAYIPRKFADKVLAQTALAGAGEKVEVTFKAPTKAGTYLFLCTFPAHFNGGMKGELVVK